MYIYKCVCNTLKQKQQLIFPWQGLYCPYMLVSLPLSNLLCPLNTYPLIYFQKDSFNLANSFFDILPTFRCFSIPNTLFFAARLTPDRLGNLRLQCQVSPWPVETAFGYLFKVNVKQKCTKEIGPTPTPINILEG